MNRKHKRVTIREVAAQAGVSISTVSHVLNRTRYVGPELSARVEVALRELGYRPNAVARSLKRRRTQSIGLIVSDISNPFFSTVARGAEDASIEEEHTLVICNTDEDESKEELYLETLISRQLDGLLIAPSGKRVKNLRALEEAGLPTVFVDRVVENIDADAVLSDNVSGAYQATKHLLKLGHRRIALILGRQSVSNTKERFEGFQRAFAEAGLQVNAHLVAQGQYRLEGGYQATRTLLQVLPRPTALFSTNNLMTIGALQAIQESGLTCPRDISLVGFDEGIWSDVCTPQLTTVVQDPYEIGYQAVRLLFEHLGKQGHRHPVVRRLPLVLKVRDSTRPRGEKP